MRGFLYFFVYKSRHQLTLRQNYQLHGTDVSIKTESLYIYIYVCVCVCVCISRRNTDTSQ